MLSPAPKTYPLSAVLSKPKKQAFLYHGEHPTPNAKNSIEAYSFHLCHKKNITFLVVLRSIHLQGPQQGTKKVLYAPILQVDKATHTLKRYAPRSGSKAFDLLAVLSQEKNALSITNAHGKRRKVKKLFNVLLKQAQKQNKTIE